MTIDEMTNEQISNLDKLNAFYESKIEVHIKLINLSSKGTNLFRNGYLIRKISDYVFILEDRVFGNLPLSVREIKENGVMEANK